MPFKIDFLESYDDESILEELRRIAHTTGKETVTKEDIARHGRLSYILVYKRFGSLRCALEKAGLTSPRYTKASDQELFHILISLWENVIESEGRTPQKKDLKEYGYPVSGDTYVRRFGSWNKALMKAYESVSKENMDAVKTEDIDSLLAGEDKSTRKALSIRKRFFVMKRDSFSCKKCRASGPGVRLEVDHVIPVAQGGTDSLDNLQTLCFECNRGKRDSLER